MTNQFSLLLAQARPMMMNHHSSYLAGIYLNTQEADTECRKFEPTDLYSYCERSHVLVTYQTLAY